MWHNTLFYVLNKDNMEHVSQVKQGHVYMFRYVRAYVGVYVRAYIHVCNCDVWDKIYVLLDNATNISALFPLLVHLSAINHNII